MRRIVKKWPFIVITLLMLFSYAAASSAQFAQCSDDPGANPYAIVVFKSKRKVIVSVNGTPQYHFPITALGKHPLGTKKWRWDGKTPEGEYCIVTKNKKSVCDRSLQINYPNVEDARRGFEHRLIKIDEYLEIVWAVANHTLPPQDTGLGFDIFIHGNTCKRHPLTTEGCIALRDKDAEKMFDLIPVGTPITIKP